MDLSQTGKGSVPILNECLRRHLRRPAERDVIAAKFFLKLALRCGTGIRSRVITVDGHQPYAHAIAELKRGGK